MTNYSRRTRIFGASHCLLAIAFLSSACSTTYQSSGWTGGYTDKQLGPGAWHVSFQGNPNRNASWVRSAAMYRAAEIAEREGYPSFQVNLDSTYVTNRAYVNFTNLVSWKADVHMKGLRSPQEGCPGRPAGCKVFGTKEALADYGKIVGQ